MKDEQKKWLNWYIGRAIKHGTLDEDRAREMTYKDKQNYLDWSDTQVNLRSKGQND